VLKVVCFGEALVDMLSARTAGDGAAQEPELFRKFPGGAPANAAVAVAKLGGDAYFAGMLGDDMFGHFLFDALQREGVKTDYLRFTTAAKTAIAFVSLDASGERSFEFYRPPAADLLFSAEDFAADTFAGSGLLHLCSNSLTEDAIADTTFAAVARAHASDWLVSVDVNLRHNLWSGGRADAARVNALAAQADIVKMSAEEFDYLGGGRDDFVRELLQQRVSLLLITDGGRPLRWISRSDEGCLQPPQVECVDSTAAGDAFIGGFIYQLAAQSVAPAALADWLGSAALDDALNFASRCGAHAVSLPGAFPSLPGRASLESLFPN